MASTLLLAPQQRPDRTAAHAAAAPPARNGAICRASRQKEWCSARSGFITPKTPIPPL